MRRGQLDGGGNSQDRRSGCRADLPLGAVWTAGGRSVLPPHRRLERSGGAGATSAHSGARVAQTRAAGGRVSPEQSGCARSAPRGRESAVAAIRGAARTARSGPSGGYTLRSGCLSTVAVVSAGRVISGVGRDIRWLFLAVSRRDRGGDATRPGHDGPCQEEEADGKEQAAGRERQRGREQHAPSEYGQAHACAGHTSCRCACVPRLALRPRPPSPAEHAGRHRPRTSWQQDCWGTTPRRPATW